MYVITGGAGFIGSALIGKLNAEGVRDIIVVDELGNADKWKNLRGKIFTEYYHKDEFLALLSTKKIPFAISHFIHLGACSSTTETNVDFLMANNFRYSVTLADYAAEKNIRFIYASSAATYGSGGQGYSDETPLEQLLPLNPYGFSKQCFDLYMYQLGFQHSEVGLKFFNVFGPNEYHKMDMRSVVHKAFEQISTKGKMQLFKSYRDDYPHGEQKRDFIYVKDCTEIIWWFLQNPKVKGIYNIGSGKARSWNDLAKAVFLALGKPPHIEYIDMPERLQAQYQYFTEARMGKLFQQGCTVEILSLEEGVEDYVRNYLNKKNQYV